MNQSIAMKLDGLDSNFRNQMDEQKNSLKPEKNRPHFSNSFYNFDQKNMKSKIPFALLISFCLTLMISCARNKGLTDEQRNRANENHRKYNQTYENEQKKN